jgi:hypothetical protein
MLEPFPVVLSFLIIDLVILDRCCYSPEQVFILFRVHAQVSCLGKHMLVVLIVVVVCHLPPFRRSLPLFSSDKDYLAKGDQRALQISLPPVRSIERGKRRCVFGDRPLLTITSSGCRLF